ncbi:MAG: hypothetical protein M3P34_05055 [Actinomycetota bacterium]|nr:hypothetical protein [Actinomycetota bacterium]
MTVTPVASPEVPWRRCRQQGCNGVAAGDEAALAHMKRAELTSALAAVGRGRPLDGRGVHTTDPCSVGCSTPPPRTPRDGRS